MQYISERTAKTAYLPYLGFFNNEFLSDCILEQLEPSPIDYKAHRIVLASSCKYFLDFFLNDENRNGKILVIPIPKHVKPQSTQNENIFPLVLKFLYTSHEKDDLFKCGLSGLNCIEFLSIFNSLECQRGKTITLEFILETVLRKDNCVAMLTDAVRLEEPALVDKAFNLVVQNFGGILTNKKEYNLILNLPFDILKSILLKDELNIDKEDILVSVVADYIRVRENLNVKGDFEENDFQYLRDIKNISVDSTLERDDLSNKSFMSHIDYDAKVQKKFRNYRLTIDEKRELVKLVRLPYLSHETLMKAAALPIFADFSTIFLESLSAKLNSYESSHIDKYTINTHPRLKYIKQNELPQQMQTPLSILNPITLIPEQEKERIGYPSTKSFEDPHLDHYKNQVTYQGKQVRPSPQTFASEIKIQPNEMGYYSKDRNFSPKSQNVLVTDKEYRIKPAENYTNYNSISSLKSSQISPIKHSHLTERDREKSPIKVPIEKFVSPKTATKSGSILDQYLSPLDSPYESMNKGTDHQMNKIHTPRDNSLRIGEGTTPKMQSPMNSGYTDKHQSLLDKVNSHQSSINLLTSGKHDHVIFTYQYDFDDNGALFFLGSSGKKKPWQNPNKLGMVKVFYSSLGKGHYDDFVGRTCVNCRTNNEPGSYMGLDFGSGRYLIPTCYTIKNRNSSHHVLINWILEGSIDGKEWFWIDKRVHQPDHDEPVVESASQVDDLKQKGFTSTWGINEEQIKKIQKHIEDVKKIKFKGFRFFKIVQVGKNSSGGHTLALSGFEVYGIGQGENWSS